ncbi:MAG: phage portal protein, partial [Akkermansia sp.]
MLQRWASRFFFGSYSPYENANVSPRRHVAAGASPQDARLDLTAGVRTELVRRSRYLVKNSGFLREIVSSMALYSVGDGIRPQAQSSDTNWNREAEAFFARWARHAELTGQFSLTESQHLICKAIDVDGEMFILKTELNGIPKIQLIESHRIGNSTDEENMIDGIKLSANGTPLSYRLLLDDGSHRDLPAHSVMHVFEPDSPSQLRGCPSLQHSINHLIDEQELLALEKHAVKANADIA